MVGINISFGNLREPDAPGPFYRPFDRLPASFSIPGHSPSWVNLPLGLLFIVAFFAQGSIITFLSNIGISHDWTGTLAIACVFLSFAIQPIVAALIRRFRSRLVHISPGKVLIEYPNNPFAGSVTVPVQEYRGLCRRWGTRYQRRRSIKQEIIELLHRDTTRTIPVRVTEEYTTNSEDLVALANQLGVDYLADSFKRSSQHARPKPQPTKTPMPRRTSQLSSPPKGVRLDTRVGTSKIATRISLDFPWNLFLSRIVMTLFTGAAMVAGWFLPSNFLLIFGGMLFFPVAWRTMVGGPGVSSLLIEGNAVTLEPDRDCFMARVKRPRANLETVRIADIQGVYTRQRQDGKRHELILQTEARELAVDLTLSRDGLEWVRDYLRMKL